MKKTKKDIHDTLENSDNAMAIKIKICKTEVGKINEVIKLAKEKETEMKTILAHHDAICIKQRKEIKINNDSILESQAELYKWMERLRRGE